MGLLVEGVWQDDVSRTKDGHFIRPTARFRNWVTPDGGPGPSGEGGFSAEPGRYHLYVSLACPWAHRTVIFRKLKALENVVGLSVVSPEMGRDGWTFDTSTGSTGDAVNGKAKLSDVYVLAEPRYTGRVSVPLLWDKRRKTIVNNESSEIIRIFNSAFDAQTNVRTDYYPAALRGEIDRLNEKIYANVNNGVYRAGFASSQEAYEEAARGVFATLDAMEAQLQRTRYLTGEYLTEADWRAFTTLVRFDVGYHGAFKCNLRRIEDYPALRGYLRELYQWPGIAKTVKLEEIKRNYYALTDRHHLYPIGPELDLSTPHGRDRLPGRGIWTRGD